MDGALDTWDSATSQAFFTLRSDEGNPVRSNAGSANC